MSRPPRQYGEWTTGSVLSASTSRRSIRSTESARICQQRLDAELAAARQKAVIEMALVEKELELHHAALDEEEVEHQSSRASQRRSDIHMRVTDWIKGQSASVNIDAIDVQDDHHAAGHGLDLQQPDLPSATTAAFPSLDMVSATAIASPDDEQSSRPGANTTKEGDVGTNSPTPDGIGISLEASSIMMQHPPSNLVQRAHDQPSQQSTAPETSAAAASALSTATLTSTATMTPVPVPAPTAVYASSLAAAPLSTAPHVQRFWASAAALPGPRLQHQPSVRAPWPTVQSQPKTQLSTHLPPVLNSALSFSVQSPQQTFPPRPVSSVSGHFTPGYPTTAAPLQPSPSAATAQPPGPRQQASCQPDPTRTVDQSIQRLADTLTATINVNRPPPVAAQPMTTSTSLDKLVARQTAINLPTFAGSPEDWPVFQQLYDSTTASCDYTNAGNLSRLQRSLKGKAKELVHSLLSVPANVPTIMKTLAMRYGRPDVIEALIAKVQSFKAISSSNLTDLMDFSSAVHNLVATIQSLHANDHLRNPQLRTTLVSRLPLSLQLQWGEHIAATGSTTVNLEIFSKWLAAKAEAASYVATLPVSHASNPTVPATPSTGDSGHHLQTAAALLAPSTAKPSCSPPKCLFCSKVHWSDECKQYTTVIARKRLLNGRCFICLRHGHAQKDCQVRRACPHCNARGKHHRSLCPKKYGSPREPATSALAATVDSTQQLSSTWPTTEPSTLASGQESAIMQTALAQVVNRSSPTTSTVRLFFDTGSYRSYISEDLAARLQLTKGKTEDLNITTFGSNNVHHLKAHTAPLTLRMNDGRTLDITATIVPTITGTILRTSIPADLQESWQHLCSTMPLADPPPCTTEHTTIELLIGNDHYADILLPERIEVQPGLYLLNSHLGWIVSGRLPQLASPATPTPSLLIATAPHRPVATDGDPLVLDKPQLDHFWDLESIGIHDSPHRSDDDTAYGLFQESIQSTNTMKLAGHGKMATIPRERLMDSELS